MIETAVKAFADIEFDHVQNGPGDYLNVFVTFRRSDLSIAERGERLMKIEQELIESVAPNLRVWHVPLGDKNTLRNLRGVDFK